MASSPSHIACDDAHEEIETLSVYNCIFCNELLNGKATLLECLHVICHKCMEEKIDDTGIKCKCLTVTDITKDSIADYPIVSPSIKKIKKCELCDLEANKYCVMCQEFYCKSCAKVHLNSSKGRAHSPDLVVVYPMVDPFILCLDCSKKNAEVNCTQCSVMICCLCHLSSHRDHDYKVLNDLCNEIKTSLSEELQKLKKSDEYLKTVLDDIPKVTQKLETQKKLVLEEINAVSQKLHDEVNKRTLELKELAELSVQDSVDKMNKYGESIKDTQDEYKYDMELVKTVMEHNEVYDLMKLSKTILKKLEPTEVMSASNQVPKLEVGIELNGQKSIDDCFSAIKNVGKITITSVGLPEISEVDIETPNSNSSSFLSKVIGVLESRRNTKLYHNCIIREENPNSFDNSVVSVDSSTESDSSDYETLVDCSCCNQWEEVSKFMQCKFCDRYFHHNCHIPAVPKSTNVQGTPTKWKCTICKDLTKYAKVLNQREMNGIIHVGRTELIIMERILMELYCQNDDSEHYRELPDPEVYTAYYLKVSSPLSLNNIKNTLESDSSYTSLIQFLLDLKKVFSNGLEYYPPCDPYYRSAAKLQICLQRLINKWIPKLRDDNRLR